MVALCGGALFALIFYRARPLTPAALLKRLPAKDSLVLAIDFASLRHAGVLQFFDASKMGREPDYEKFVEETQFNYTQRPGLRGGRIRSLWQVHFGERPLRLEGIARVCHTAGRPML